ADGGPSAGSGPGGEPPGRGGAAAGAGHELERHLIAWLDAVEKGHLVEALSLAEEVPGEAGARLRQEDVADHTRCRLGRWYYGPDGQRLAGHPVFRAVEDPHRRLHEAAARAVEAWNAG